MNITWLNTWNILRKSLLIILTVLTVFFFLPNKTYATSGNTYTVKSNVDDLAYPTWGGSQHRQITRDSNSNLYVVYSDTGAGSQMNIFLAKSTDQGQTWTSEAVTTDDSNWQGGPSIAIDGEDNIHVVWNGYTTNSPANNQIRYRKYTSSWQPIEELTTEANRPQEYPSIAIDSQDNIHVAWDGNTAGSPVNYQIRYRKYTSSWQAIEEITSNANFDQIWNSIAIDSQDNIHVVWRGAVSGLNASQIRYRERTNSWQPIVELTNDNNNWQDSPAIAIDSQDNIHVVWYGNTVGSPVNNQIRYRKYTSSWQAIEEITSNANYNQVLPTIALDSHDNIHFAWEGYTANSLAVSQIRYRKYTSSWQAIEELTSSQNNQINSSIIWAEWPRYCNAQTDETKDGFFVIWSEQIGVWPNITSFNIKDFVSSDLDWQSQSCPESTPAPTPTPNPTSTLNILPQTGANLNS